MFPDMQKIATKSLEELLSLTIAEVSWNPLVTLGFRLTDGQFCSIGYDPVDNMHKFDPSKKITKVQHIIHKREITIL